MGICFADRRMIGPLDQETGSVPVNDAKSSEANPSEGMPPP